MVFAFGHLIGAWLIGKSYEKWGKKKISRYGWFFLLIGGILPDADFLIDWTINTDLHRTFSHSIFFMLLIPIIVYFMFYKLQERKQVSVAIGVGIFTHIFLDIISSSHGLMLLWPSSLHFTFTKVYTHTLQNTAFLNGDMNLLIHQLKLAVIDMALGIIWIFYLWWKKKIQF